MTDDLLEQLRARNPAPAPLPPPPIDDLLARIAAGERPSTSRWPAWAHAITGDRGRRRGRRVRDRLDRRPAPRCDSSRSRRTGTQPRPRTRSRLS